MAYSAPESQKPGLLDHPVSLFQGAFKTEVVETLPLGTVLQRIKDGTYHEAIAHVRKQKARGKAAYTTAKDALLAFTPCCALRTRAAAVPWSEKLISPTGLVHFDFDQVPDPAVLKSRLASNRSSAKVTL